MAFDPGQLYNNPYMQLGAGLLMGAAPGGTFAGGLNMGLHNLQNMQRQQQATAMLGLQIQAMQAKRMEEERKRAEAQALAQAYGLPQGVTPTSAQINSLSMAGGDPAKYQQILQEQTKKVPLVANYVGSESQALRELTPAEQAVVATGQPYVDTKGNLQTAPDLPQYQHEAAGFARRMVTSGDLLDKLDADEVMAGSYSGRQGMLPGEMQSSVYQQVDQAQNEWIRAKLRKESGAVIGKDEMEQERATYFPEPGDSEQVIAQKRAARVEATEAMLGTASNAYKGPEFATKVYRTPQQPTEGKPGDIWITPEGRFYVYE